MNKSTPPESAPEAWQRLQGYLHLAVQKGASDLYLTTNAPPMLRVEGEMVAIGKTLLTDDAIRDMAMEATDSRQKQILATNLELDLALQLENIGRFRANIFHQRNTFAMCFRHVKGDIPSLHELRMPRSIKDLALMKRGLILMVGATGSGKSTTLAAMIQHRNQTLSNHILTIEDPIEFVHPNLKSIVNQREIGQDTLSYERALMSALREAPDVILIGEIRSRDTMDAALQLANTGHLAIASLHANNSDQALQRILNLYPENGRDQLYLDLSMTLQAILSQRLVRAVDNKRVAAVEVLINSPYISDLIKAKKISEIKDAMSMSSDRNMQSFDQSLLMLYQSKIIELEEALSNADSPSNLQTKISFGG